MIATAPGFLEKVRAAADSIEELIHVRRQIIRVVEDFTGRKSPELRSDQARMLRVYRRFLHRLRHWEGGE